MGFLISIHPDKKILSSDSFGFHMEIFYSLLVRLSFGFPIEIFYSTLVRLTTQVFISLALGNKDPMEG